MLEPRPPSSMLLAVGYVHNHRYAGVYQFAIGLYRRSSTVLSTTAFTNRNLLGAMRLCHHGAGSCTLVLPVWLQNTDGLVVSAETVDSGFDQDEAELGVLVLAVALEVLPDGDGLLDQHVEIFWDFWCKTIRLEDSQNLVTSDDLDLSDTMAVS